MRLGDQHDVRLSTEDVHTLLIGLSAYLREFASHRAEDDGATHPEAEWQALRKQVGRLIWRLEEITKPTGASIVHSEDAVPPDADDDGTAGVREPLRPHDAPPSLAAETERDRT